MHIETNVCDNLLGTLNLLGGDKNKDGRNARLDMKRWGIRPELHVSKDPNLQRKLSAIIHILTRIHKTDVCNFLRNIRVQIATPPTYQDVHILPIES